MKFADRVFGPAIKEDHFGRFYCQPLRIFRERGHNWSIRLEWPREISVVMNGDEKILVEHYGKPKALFNNDGPCRDDEGNLCTCAECVAGRKEVKAGWTPWGKDFGFPK